LGYYEHNKGAGWGRRRRKRKKTTVRGERNQGDGGGRNLWRGRHWRGRKEGKGGSFLLRDYPIPRRTLER